MPARAGHLAELRAIELAAAALLRGHAPDAVLEETTPAAILAAAVRAGRLWVALDADRPVGFALAERIADDLPHLAELDVEPAHGGRASAAPSSRRSPGGRDARAARSSR